MHQAPPTKSEAELKQNLEGFEHDYFYDPFDESGPHIGKPETEKVSVELSKAIRELLVDNPEGNLNISWK